MPKFALMLTLAAASVVLSACGGSQKDERIEAAVSEAQRANAETDALKIRVENLESRLEHDEGMYADGDPVAAKPGAAPSASPAPVATTAPKPRTEKPHGMHGGGHERRGDRKNRR